MATICNSITMLGSTVTVNNPFLLTSKSKHYGFIQFEDTEIAEIAVDAMQDYLILEHMLYVHVIPPEDVKPNLYMSLCLLGVHENWFAARCLNTTQPAGQGVIVMQTAVYVLIALYDGSIGSASQAMAAADQFASQLSLKRSDWSQSPKRSEDVKPTLLFGSKNEPAPPKQNGDNNKSIISTTEDL